MEPADWGPTRMAPASSHAMEPPPAPMTWMSTTDICTGSPSSLAWLEPDGSPSMMRLASNEVPPMSMQMRLGRPVAADSALPPMAPPTGPERSVCSGVSLAVSAVITPPFDCMTWSPRPCGRRSLRPPIRVSR